MAPPVELRLRLRSVPVVWPGATSYTPLKVEVYRLLLLSTARFSASPAGAGIVRNGEVFPFLYSVTVPLPTFATYTVPSAPTVMPVGLSTPVEIVNDGDVPPGAYSVTLLLPILVAYRFSFLSTKSRSGDESPSVISPSGCWFEPFVDQSQIVFVS